MFVVDGDVGVRRTLEVLIESSGWRALTFSTAEAFLACPAAGEAGCLVLDVRLPDIDGLDLQSRITRDREELPIIFLSGCSDVPTTVRAMKAGAVEFLTKPFAETAVLAAIAAALQRGRIAAARKAELRLLRERYATVRPRERQVMAMVTAGRLNKQIANDLGLSEVTVKVHRGSVMRKMAARTLADLVRMADTLCGFAQPFAGDRTVSP